MSTPRFHQHTSLTIAEVPIYPCENPQCANTEAYRSSELYWFGGGQDSSEFKNRHGFFCDDCWQACIELLAPGQNVTGRHIRVSLHQCAVQRLGYDIKVPPRNVPGLSARENVKYDNAVAYYSAWLFSLSRHRRPDRGIVRLECASICMPLCMGHMYE